MSVVVVVGMAVVAVVVVMAVMVIVVGGVEVGVIAVVFVRLRKDSRRRSPAKTRWSPVASTRIPPETRKTLETSAPLCTLRVTKSLRAVAVAVAVALAAAAVAVAVAAVVAVKLIATAGPLGPECGTWKETALGGECSSSTGWVSSRAWRGSTLTRWPSDACWALVLAEKSGA